MTLPEKLKELRLKRGWTQLDVAKRTGVDRSYISYLEQPTSNDARPSADALLKLARAFNIKPEDLYQAAGYIKESSPASPRPETPEEILDRLKLATPVSIPVYTDYPFHAGDPVEPVEFIYRARAKLASKNIEGYVVHGKCLEPQVNNGDIVLIDTGIRREELAKIKVADINLDARLISITGKGRKQRLMPISAATLKAIWRYLKERRNPGEFLWLTEEGRPITGDGIGQMLQNLMKAVGVTHKASCHVFRHTFANDRLDEGMDSLDLQYLLGHTSLKMVEGYSRAHKQRRALKALERQRPVDRLIK